jgi:hypothetical protein
MKKLLVILTLFLTVVTSSLFSGCSSDSDSGSDGDTGTGDTDTDSDSDSDSDADSDSDSDTDSDTDADSDAQKSLDEAITTMCKKWQECEEGSFNMTFGDIDTCIDAIKSANYSKCSEYDAAEGAACSDDVSAMTCQDFMSAVQGNSLPQPCDDMCSGVADTDIVQDSDTTVQGGDVVGSCIQTDFCQEYYGADYEAIGADGIKTICEAGGGTFGSGSCSTSGCFGQCDSNGINTVYYNTVDPSSCASPGVWTSCK